MPVLNVLNQIVNGLQYHLAVDNNNNIVVAASGGATRIITENGSSIIAITKALNTEYKYEQIVFTAVDQWATNETIINVYNSSGSGYQVDNSLTTKKVGGKWITLDQTGTVFSLVPQNLYNYYNNGVWVTRMWFAWNQYQYYITDLDSSNKLYSYTINFEDGTQLTNMMLESIEFTQNGVYLTFASAEIAWLSALPAITQNANTI